MGFDLGDQSRVVFILGKTFTAQGCARGKYHYRGKSIYNCRRDRRSGQAMPRAKRPTRLNYLSGLRTTSLSVLALYFPSPIPRNAMLPPSGSQPSMSRWNELISTCWGQPRRKNRSWLMRFLDHACRGADGDPLQHDGQYQGPGIRLANLYSCLGLRVRGHWWVRKVGQNSRRSERWN